MAVIKLFSTNPKDGATTFDKIRFYEANDAEGAGAAKIAEIAVDVSKKTLIDPGFTTYLYTSGSTSKYYASSYYNVGSGTETSKSAWTKGGQNRWDKMLLDWAEDDDEEVFDEDARSLFNKNILERLSPELEETLVNTTLTWDEDALTYTVPDGISEILEIGIGDVDKAGEFDEPLSELWSVEGRTLRFTKAPSGVNDGDTMRLIHKRRHEEVGEVPTIYDPLILIGLQAEAYKWMASYYPRFEKFAQLRGGSGVSFEGLRAAAKDLDDEFKVMKLKLARGDDAQPAYT